MALFAPAGTPKTIVDKLNAAINKGLEDRAIAETYQRIGMVVERGSPEDMGRLYLLEVQRSAKVAKEAGVVLE